MRSFLNADGGQMTDWLHVFALFVDLIFMEASALTGENVEETFLKCSRTILSKIDSG